MKETGEIATSERPEEWQLENFLPYRLSVAADAVSRLILRQHLDSIGLGMSEWRLLAAVGRSTVLSPTAAGERTSMDKVKVSRAAASLVARGILKQTQDPEDGRGRLLRLTRKGTALYAGVAATGKSIESSLSSGLSKSEWNTLHRTLGKLIDHTRHLMADDGDET